MTLNTPQSPNPIRAMVVDDSAVIRGLITKILESDPDIQVVATVGNGELAVKQLQRTPVDVIILDIEMPVMDGLTALPKLLEIDSGVKIIMASTLTVHNAEISLKALQAGATDYVPKPTSTSEIGGAGDFRRDILDRVKVLGQSRRNRPGRAVPASPVAPKAPAAGSAPAPVKKAMPSLAPGQAPTLRSPGTVKPDILAVGSSTGGPQALFDFFKALDKDIGVPVVITQHMPATFTTILAQHISKMAGWDCREAKDGDHLMPGKILLAPGDYHMTVVNDGPRRVIKLNQDAPENFCRPAVDPMLRSLVKVYGPRILTVILTGMGNDGEKGSRLVVESGGTVVAQDEASSVVWGMPGAVTLAGVCSAVEPIPSLAGYVSRFLKK